VARTVRWTEAALEDLSATAEFIARDSRFYAMALVREARAAARSLKTHAERGRTVPEARSAEVRELFVKSYRLIYQVSPTAILIVAFVHGARDLKTLWEREGGPPAGRRT
jgi:toxin ParE1/3/4